MAKDINLTSQQWNDIIFEGKNKEYGAYEMRQSSSKRHVTALLSTLVLAIFVAIIPSLANKIKELRHKPENITTDVVLRSLTEQIEEEQQKNIDELQIPEEIRNTVGFTDFVIVDESQIVEERQAVSITEVLDSKALISVMTHTGGSDVSGVDLGLQKLHDDVAGTSGTFQVWEVSETPTFPGGDEELRKFLFENLVYPAVERNIGTEGIVQVSFVVSRTGAITEVFAQKSPSRGLSAEAVRVVKKMPPWLPGKQNGKPVAVRFILPIEFKLQ